MPQEVPIKQGLLKRLWGSWATRSLAVGGVATALDLAVGLSLRGADVSVPVAARVGVAIGSTFTFAANRYFAFREHNPGVTTRSLIFILTMGGGVALASALAAGFVPAPWFWPWLIGVCAVGISLPLQIHWLRHSDPDLKGQVTKFATTTLVSMWLHGYLVKALNDVLVRGLEGHLAFAASKMAADLVVFTFVQLLLLRYLVFKKKHPGSGQPTPATEVVAESPTGSH